jgi:hypothetical protein
VTAWDDADVSNTQPLIMPPFVLSTLPVMPAEAIDTALKQNNKVNSAEKSAHRTNLCNIKMHFDVDVKRRTNNEDNHLPHGVSKRMDINLSYFLDKLLPFDTCNIAFSGVTNKRYVQNK